MRRPDSDTSSMTAMTAPSVVAVQPVDADHEVVTISDGGDDYRRRPCAQCPWRVDQAETFPAGAFRHSARTATDMSTHVFACHMAGTERTRTCAGFLLRGAAHNLTVRVRLIRGSIDPDELDDAGLELFDGYYEMAVANGVDPDDPALRCIRRD